MRALALLPLLCVCTSTVLAVLCIMAGYRSNFMEGFELVTFNTSLLGESLVEAAAQQQLSGVTSELNIPSGLATALASLLASQNSSVLVQQVAERLNIRDFYKIHMLDHCEGYYEPGPVPNGSFTNPSQNVTYCSPPQAFSFFNATQVLQDELLSGVSLSDINFPSEVTDAIGAMAVVQKVMFVLYCIGAGIGGLAALEAILAFFLDGRLSAMCNAVLDIFAFITIGVASGCATAFIYVVTNAVNQYGSQVNLQAYKGTNFLIISWIATALALVASLLWCVDCCVGPSRRSRRSSRRKEGY